MAVFWTVLTQQSFRYFIEAWAPSQLFNMGIKGQMWSILHDRNIETSSAIVVNQTQTRWFAVQQGVRQGSVLSTFSIQLVVYINDLILTLRQLFQNTGIPNITSNCPSLADKFHSNKRKSNLDHVCYLGNDTTFHQTHTTIWVSL